MHIIAGTLKGQSIQYPKDRSFRPTKAVVREAVFSSLSNAISGTRFLDLCSGSGAMGFEALSRGAAQVICVDQNVHYLKQNAKKLQVNVQIIRSNILSFLSKTSDSYGVIYLDPVWADVSVYNQAIDCIIDRQLVLPGGYLFVEHDATFECSINVPGVVFKHYKYGNTRLTRYWFKQGC